MKFLALTFVLVVLCSCSSKEYRTKYSDKNMRIMIDPSSLNEQNFVRLQTALVKENTWTVVDRGAGFKAIQKEQERLHRNDPDRFNDADKWAHWGRLYGIGAVIVGNVQCFNTSTFWNRDKTISQCSLFINLVDANTGEVVAAVEGNERTALHTAPSWEKTVKELSDVYPKFFTEEKISERLDHYRQVSKEHSRRQQENKED